jgi:hypothetical protein
MVKNVLVGVGAVVCGVAVGVAVMAAKRRKTAALRESKELSPFEIAVQLEEQLRAAYNEAESKWLALSTEEVKVWRAWMAASASDSRRLYAEELRLKDAVNQAKAEMDRLSGELHAAGRARVQASFERPGHDLSCNIWHDASENAPCTCSCG